MAYNETLADRILEKLEHLGGLEAKKMMGGWCLMYQQKMCCGVVKDNLMVRVSPERYEEALSNPHARKMDFTGKPLKNFVYVDEFGYTKDKDLAYWLEMSIEYVEQLPEPKKKKKAAKKVKSKKVLKKAAKASTRKKK